MKADKPKGQKVLPIRGTTIAILIHQEIASQANGCRAADDQTSLDPKIAGLNPGPNPM